MLFPFFYILLKTLSSGLTTIASFVRKLQNQPGGDESYVPPFGQKHPARVCNRALLRFQRHRAVAIINVAIELPTTDKSLRPATRIPPVRFLDRGVGCASGRAARRNQQRAVDPWRLRHLRKLDGRARDDRQELQYLQRC